MLRKLTIVMCLISFAPAAVNAQGLAAISAPQAAVEPAVAQPLAAGREINPLLPTERSAAVLLAATEPSQGVAVGCVQEEKKESRRTHSWDNFVEVHFGDYRWVWWAGAAAILIAIHVGAD